MRCSWAESHTRSTHIPQMCKKDSVVIYVGPRKHQVDSLCEEHRKFYERTRINDQHPWEALTPAEYEVHRVMSE
jgi:hypothetical protein